MIRQAHFGGFCTIKFKSSTASKYFPLHVSRIKKVWLTWWMRKQFWWQVKQDWKEPILGFNQRQLRVRLQTGIFLLIDCFDYWLYLLTFLSTWIDICWHFSPEKLRFAKKKCADYLRFSGIIFAQMNAIVNALSAENERERKGSPDLAETPRLQENLRKLVNDLKPT